jgi:hypothetical protein
MSRDLNKRALDLIDYAQGLFEEAAESTFARRSATEEAEDTIRTLGRFLCDNGNQGQSLWALCALRGLTDEQSLEERQAALSCVRKLFERP